MIVQADNLNLTLIADNGQILEKSVDDIFPSYTLYTETIYHYPTLTINLWHTSLISKIKLNILLKRLPLGAI